MSKKSLHIKVSGRVQGVHFRGTVRNYASILGLTGSVRNLPDGSVEIQAEGEDNTLTSFLRLVQHGSLLSRVTGLEYTWGKPAKLDQPFSVMHRGNLLEDEILSLSNLGKNVLFPTDAIIPQHIAIIPDGNRRWAKEKGLPSFEGHKQGFNRLKELSAVTREAGIKTVTVWGFSTENWTREKNEVKYLFEIFDTLIKRLSADTKDNEIRFRHLGRKDRIPEKIVNRLVALEKATQRYSKYFLNLALDYGGRDEILRGIKKLIDSRVAVGLIDDQLFSQQLDTAGISDPDLIIRTSGEQRLSGLLPWQGAYSELYFAPVHFPDFDASQLKLALLEYSQRQRRFGS